MKSKKKVIGLSLAIIILFTGTVFAATNGLFEGFSIVNVVVNGKVVKGDVPGINFNGRTMVPIRLVSEELGANVSWDQQTYTAYITADDVNKGKYSQEDIDKIKLYNRILGYYSRLENLGTSLADTEQGLAQAYTGLIYLQRVDGLEQAFDQFEYFVERHDILLEQTKHNINEAKKQNIDISDMNEILFKYSEAIDYYYAAFSYLVDYDVSRKESDFNKYLSNRSAASDAVYDALYKILPRDEEFYNKIQNY